MLPPKYKLPEQAITVIVKSKMGLIFSGIFIQVPLSKKYALPTEKPPIECILSTSADAEINKQLVIDTPLLYPEKPTLPLKKVLVTGDINVKVKYSALVEDQQVHLAHFDIDFCSLIEWPGGPPQGTPILVKPTFEKAIHIMKGPRLIYSAFIIRMDVYV